MATFKATQVLLAKPRPRFDILLGKTFLPPEARKISANQLTHVHDRTIAIYIL